MIGENEVPFGASFLLTPITKNKMTIVNKSEIIEV